MADFIGLHITGKVEDNLDPKTICTKYFMGHLPWFARNPNGKSGQIGSIVLICIALTVITLAIYMQVGNHPFLNFDDPSYVTENPHVATGITIKNITWAFGSFDAANWHPVTWLSHMADAHIFGLNPRGHHLTSVVIHCISSVLLLLFLLRATGSLWQSSFVATLFALHPLHVESVAWVAERKDVLSAFFLFLTLLLHAEYAAKRKPALYFYALFSFVLGLMSKPMLVTLPIILLLLDFWPLNRYRRDELEQGLGQLSASAVSLIKEKIPFFACSLISGIVTIYAQHTGGATRSFEEFPFMLRMENSLIAYVKYIIKTFWPDDLAILYPISSSFPLWQIIGSLLVLLLVSTVVIRFARRFPYLAVGWFWFLITLLPVIGLLQVGTQSMADRYMYIPAIGLFIMVAWGTPDLIKGMHYRNGVLALLAGTVIVASVVLTWRQLSYWRDNISLYRHSLQVAPGSYLVHKNLGINLAEKGNIEAAIYEFNEAIRISPNDPDSHSNLGRALTEKGDLDSAIRECQLALQLSPDYADFHYNLGVLLDKKGYLEAAIDEYQKAIRISPNDSRAHNNLGVDLVIKGNFDAAIREYQAALQITPDDAKTHFNLGRVFAKNGNLDAAIQEFRVSLRISPDNIDAFKNLGITFVNKGDLEGAVREFQNALRLSPNDIDAHSNLGVVLAKKGDLDVAIQEFQIVLRLSPNDVFAQNNLKIALAQKNKK